MSEARLSVVIPAYRAAGVIGRAIASVLAQTRPADEILIVDDGSPDDVAAALTPFRQRVRLIRQANGGAGSARNRGIEEATGELIAFLDADDYWEPHKLARQFDVLRQYPEVGLTACRWFDQWPRHERQPSPISGPEWCDRVLTVRGGDTLLAARRMATSTVLCRRSALGSLRFDTTLRTAEDVDLWIRLLRATPAYLLSERLITMVLEPGSLSRGDADADCPNMLRVIRRYGDLLGPGGLRAWEASLFREWAAGHLGAGAPRRALRPAWERWQRQWWSPQANWILAKVLIRSAL